jgi:hypothetical protein
MYFCKKTRREELGDLMYKFVFKLLRVSTAVIAATVFLAGNGAVKAESKTESKLPEAQPGVEVQRTDWSYQTLQALAKKYDCLPADSVLFTTKRDYVSRQVFTTNLSTCLQSMEELVARRRTRRRPAVRRRVVVPAPVAPVEPVAPEPAPVAPVEPAPVAPPAPPIVEIQEEPTQAITQQDLDNIKALVSTFDSDLAALEKRITSKSFSTTTKLVGEGIISFSGYGGVTAIPASAPGVTPAVTGRASNNNIFTNRIRLNFDTSFTGKDRLRTRIQARNTTPFNSTVTGTNATRLGYDGNDDNNDARISLIQYDLPLGDLTKIRLATVGYEFNDNSPTLNPLLASAANGSISRFGRFNPIFRQGNGDGAAVTVSQKFSDSLSFDLGYTVPGTGAASVLPSSGFFSGSNTILSQLTFSPDKNFNLAALYGRSYYTAGAGVSAATGSLAADNPFNGAPTTANHYSFLATYKLGDGAVISGWAGFTSANREAAGGGSAETSNYALTLAFPNFGAEGNMLGFVFGLPPKLNSRTVPTGTALGSVAGGNPDTSYHLEALYKVKLNDNIDVTPGIFLITNPENNRANKTEYVGTIRTTFRF